MKKVINGKMYNTDTAREVASWWNGKGYRDFSHVSETLFRKKTGEFFLYGQGGPISKYGRSDGQGGWDGGDKIVPFGMYEAMDWCIENEESLRECMYNFLDVCNQLFGSGVLDNYKVKKKMKKFYVYDNEYDSFDEAAKFAISLHKESVPVFGKNDFEKSQIAVIRFYKEYKVIDPDISDFDASDTFYLESWY